MAITTLDGLLAGFNAQGGLNMFWMTHMLSTEVPEAVGQLHNLCYTPGIPGASVMPSTNMVGQALTSRSGQLPFTNPVSGNTYLAKFWASANTNSNSFILIDRLWHNLVTSTSTVAEQSINGMSTLPARDANGSTAGYGLGLAIEVYSTTGNNSAITNMWVRYTNHLGSTGKIASCPSFPPTAQKGTFVVIPLQAGDLGVQAVNGIALGTTLSIGNVGLVLFRQLGQVGAMQVGMGGQIDPVSSGMPRLYDNTVPEVLLLPNSTSQLLMHGQVVYTQG
jgi:hypothetical protein